MEIKTIGVLGAGLMGNGIAQVCAQAGYDVVMRDIEDRFVQNGLKSVQGNLDRQVKKEKMTKEKAAEIMGRIRGTLLLEEMGGCDLIIEAIIENRDLKKQAYQQLDTICGPDTVFASNTSSLSITDLASLTKRPQKFVGVHFFNPVPVMNLVEIIRGLETSDETVALVQGVVEKVEKQPVSVKDSAGFVVNRLLIPMLNEAAFVFAEGVASREDIDYAMQLGCNHPIGPLALMDLIGLDTTLAIMDVLYCEFGDSKYRACPLIRQMVRAGKLGRKSGKGFYDYNK